MSWLSSAMNDGLLGSAFEKEPKAKKRGPIVPTDLGDPTSKVNAYLERPENFWDGDQFMIPGWSGQQPALQQMPQQGVLGQQVQSANPMQQSIQGQGPLAQLGLGGLLQMLQARKQEGPNRTSPFSDRSRNFGLLGPTQRRGMNETRMGGPRG